MCAALHSHTDVPIMGPLDSPQGVLLPIGGCSSERRIVPRGSNCLSLGKFLLPSRPIEISYSDASPLSVLTVTLLCPHKQRQFAGNTQIYEAFFARA